MGYQALLFCPDDRTARTVMQVLSELEFTVEACIEPFAAVKKLMGQHFDAVVVDCDNEQNATLLFKSARNSTSNQTSLAVAVVEGQAGVAKAFRIGANLVLTKPINIEQAKGTLRVARGLLRKSDPTKPGSATATGSFAVPAAPPATSTPAPATSPTSASVAAKPAAPKPAPAARPTQPAQVPPRAVAPTATATFKPQQAPTSKPSAPSAWPTAAASTKPAPTVQTAPTLAGEKPEASPAAPLYSAAVATQVAPKMAATAATAGFKPSVSSMPAASGAASAPAAAREPQIQKIEEKPSAAATDLLEKPAEPAHSEPAAYVGSAPSFSFGGTTKEHEPSRGSKKVLIGVAAAVLVAAGAYFAWSHFKGTGSTSQPVATSAPVSSPGTPTNTPPGATTTAATPASQPDITLANSESATERHSTSPTSVPSSRPSAGSTKSVSASSAPARSVVAEKPAPEEEPDTPALIVKGGKVPAAQPTPAQTPDAPAPSLIGMGAPNTSSLPNLGTSDSGVTPKLQTLSVSQGVSQGLLYRKVAPSYPSNALRMHIEGEVQLQATISKQGDITRIKVLSGDAQLAKAASDAVKQWKYKPYLLNGEPVEIQTQVTVHFKLPH